MTIRRLCFLPFVLLLLSTPPFPVICRADYTYWWRPALHWTPDLNWVNDPNGLLYDSRTRLWHLFAQYNPYSEDGSDSQSWSHAVSSDLIRWQQLPLAIRVGDGVNIWSGSAVLDHNSSGLCTLPAQPCIVAVYCGQSPQTGTQNINIASSTDAALTAFRKYPHNPVIDIGSSAFRDPAAFWYSSASGLRRPHSASDAGYWLVVITHSDVHKMELWQSADLIAWSHMSDFVTGTDGNWDCPDLYPMQLQSGGSGSGSNETYWILSASFSGTPGGYWVGRFDGRVFSSLYGTSWSLIDYGTDSYASISYNDAPDDRRVMLSWLSNWAYASSIPTQPWRGSASLPRDLTLHAHQTANGSTVLYIHAQPSPELFTYRKQHYSLPSSQQPISVAAASKQSIVRDLLNFPGGTVYEIYAVLSSQCITPPCSCVFHLRLDRETGQSFQLGLRITDRDAAFVHFMNRSHSGRQDISDPYNDYWSPALPAVTETMDRTLPIDIRIVLDVSCVEVFMLGGLIAAGYQFFALPFHNNWAFEFEVTEGEWTVQSMDIWTYQEPQLTVE